MRLALIPALCCAAASASAAVTIDLDLARLKVMPDAGSIRSRLEASLPAQAKARLEALASLGCDLRQDLERVVIDLPDQGAPSVRLVGLKAQRIASLLALRSAGTAMAGGTGYALPHRPLAAFVAVGEREALIGRGTALAAVGAPAPLPALDPAQPIRIHLVPGPQPRVPALALVADLRLASDGAGHLALTATARSQQDAAEIERRVEVLRRMVAVGSEGGLPEMADAGRLLAATSLQRSGTTLAAVVTVPDDLRRKAIDRAVERIGSRMGAGAAP